MFKDIMVTYIGWPFYGCAATTFGREPLYIDVFSPPYLEACLLEVLENQDAP